MRPIDRRFFRDNFLGLSLTLVGVLCLVLSGISYLNHRQLGRFALASGGGLDGADIEMLERQNKAYERIAESVTPAVVSIQSTSVVKVQQSPFSMDPLFRQFFGDMIPQFNIPRQYREHALGSGVIVSPEGYLLTNNHVIRNASSIDVLLSDKRNFKAKVVGADPQLLVEEAVTCVVQVAGKVRARLDVPPSIGDAELRERALADEAVVRALDGRGVRTVVVRAPKLVNIVPV